MQESDPFCHADAPAELRAAVRDFRTLQDWVKKRTDAELAAALDFIYVHHAHQRAIIKDEIEARRHAKLEGRLDALKTPHWTVLPNFWFTLVSAVAAVVAAYFAWRALKP